MNIFKPQLCYGHLQAQLASAKCDTNIVYVNTSNILFNRKLDNIIASSQLQHVHGHVCVNIYSTVRSSISDMLCEQHNYTITMVNLYNFTLNASQHLYAATLIYLRCLSRLLFTDSILHHSIYHQVLYTSYLQICILMLIVTKSDFINYKHENVQTQTGRTMVTV